MDADLKVFINKIMEKTGISFSVYSKSGEFLAGVENNNEIFSSQIEGIVIDKEKDRTYFSINYKNKGLIGIIKGSGAIEKNYAYLISELAENYFFKETGMSRSEFFKSVLLGEASQSQITRLMRKFSVQDLPAFVMLISTDAQHIFDAYNIVNNCLEEMDFVVKIDDEQLAFVKFIVDENEEYQSPTEYAEFIKLSIYEEIGINVKISIGGIVKTIAELSNSFAQAISTYRMHVILGSKGEIHSYKEYMLIKMLEDLPKHKLNENLNLLMDSGAKEIFSDEEMINTAEEFLENSLNTSETSRKLYLHRNTLIYRLDKIEKSTGLNIRKFSDAITFRLITILSRLVK